MPKKIVFTDTVSGGAWEKPQPASQYLPEWYKKMATYTGGEKKRWVFSEQDNNYHTYATIKKCLPVFDAITAGYIITTYCDIDVVILETGEQMFYWTQFDSIMFHAVEQAPDHPKAGLFAYPKFRNPWAIKTPAGYSVLIIPPMHRDSPFEIFEGVVDTDKWSSAVNLPFQFKDPSWTGTIPAGTPIAQVIPFKREDWVSELGNQDDYNNHIHLLTKLKSVWYDAYKNFWRSPKSYK